jgi:hypothetical protein
MIFHFLCEWEWNRYPLLHTKYCGGIGVLAVSTVQGQYKVPRGWNFRNNGTVSLDEDSGDLLMASRVARTSVEISHLPYSYLKLIVCGRRFP